MAGTGLDVKVTGAAATNIDITDYLAERMLVFFGAVLALSFVLLMTLFRSVLVPVKAVLMNVLSIGAAYGIVVAVFQWGWAGSLVGIEGGPINPFVPMMLFAVVFGLSMDYEVFMLSRIREEYDRTGDPSGSVADGLAATARVITAAAAIMVAVFASFVLEDIREIKLFGLGLAVAVFLDATVVRMVMVPATMALGRRRGLQRGRRSSGRRRRDGRLGVRASRRGGRNAPRRGRRCIRALAPGEPRALGQHAHRTRSAAGSVVVLVSRPRGRCDHRGCRCDCREPAPSTRGHSTAAGLSWPRIEESPSSTSP